MGGITINMLPQGAYRDILVEAQKRGLIICPELTAGADVILIGMADMVAEQSWRARRIASGLDTKWTIGR